jgi:hypothetical protein
VTTTLLEEVVADCDIIDLLGAGRFEEGAKWEAMALKIIEAENADEAGTLTAKLADAAREAAQLKPELQRVVAAQQAIATASTQDIYFKFVVGLWLQYHAFHECIRNADGCGLAVIKSVRRLVWRCNEPVLITLYVSCYRGSWMLTD